MRYGEIYSYRNAKEAKQYSGKKGMFSDCLRRIEETPSECFGGTLVKVKNEAAGPFNVAEGYGFQFFRPILEEDEPLMTNRQLSEWLAKGKGEYSREEISAAISKREYPKVEEDVPVRDDILIRHWGDSEWSKPTRAIYEEDCLMNNAINKEDCK